MVIITATKHICINQFFAASLNDSAANTQILPPQNNNDDCEERQRARTAITGRRKNRLYFLGDLCVMYNKLQVIFYKLRNTPLDDGFYRGEGVMSVVCMRLLSPCGFNYAVMNVDIICLMLSFPRF